jgi:carboxyl-terminal processing protease
MQWTEIAPASYTKYAKAIQNIDELKKLSAERVKKNSTFSMIEENAKFLKQQRDRTTLPLNLEEYKAAQEKIKEMNKKFEDIKKEIPELSPALLKVDFPRTETDTTYKKRSDEWLKELKKDIYLLESLAILKDMK